MHLADYQAKAIKTYKVDENEPLKYRLARLTLGICGESGEFAEKIKKVLRGDKELGEVVPELEKELGDVLWYCAAISYELTTHLDRIAALNLEKLDSRDRRGVIKGSGDAR